MPVPASIVRDLAFAFPWPLRVFVKLISLLLVENLTGDALVPAATKTSPPYDWAPVVLIAEFNLIADPVTVKDGNVKPLETDSWDDVEVALIVGFAPNALAEPATIDPPAILVPPV